MPKMLMGQIEHARSRVRSITSSALGGTPRSPQKYGVPQLRKALEKGTEIEASIITQAFSDWLNKVPVSVVEVNRPYNYSYGRRNYSDSEISYKTKEETLGSIEDYIAAAVYSERNNAEVARFDRDLAVWNERKELLETESADVEDKIVLGDQQAALLALEAFAMFAKNLATPGISTGENPEGTDWDD